MATVKLLEKPIRKLPDGLPEIQDRIEYIRCILGYPLKPFIRKMGFTLPGYQKIMVRNETKTGWFITLIERVVSILDVDKAWIYMGTGSPYGKKSYDDHMYSNSSEGVDKRGLRKEIGRRFKSVREDKNLTQAIFGSSLGIGLSHVSKIEAGVLMPTIPAINKLIKKYGVLDPWLLRGEGPRYPR